MTEEDLKKEYEKTRAMINKGDPSQYYKILSRIGTTSHSKIFKVERTFDKSIFCLIFSDKAKTEKEKQEAFNQIHMMRMAESKYVLKLVEFFDFKKRSWLFCEEYKGDMTELI